MAADPMTRDGTTRALADGHRMPLLGLGDPAVAAIAADAGRTPAQVLLRWSVQRGIPVITKSTSSAIENRIKWR